MRIDSATIGMESARSYRTFSATSIRRFVITDYQESLEGNQNLDTAVEEDEEEEKNTQSAEKNEVTMEEWYQRMNITSGRVKVRNSVENTLTDIRQLTLRYIFELLFAERRGKRNEFLEERGWSSGSTDMESAMANGSISLQGFGTLGIQAIQYTRETCLTETQEASFSTVGTVKTADGREISFRVNVEMSRAFSQYYSENLAVASFQMCDPLVINLDTDVAEFSDQNFYFDIDADGVEDQIAQLSAKSGYLALDKNGDGKINDGSELFGTVTGDGFADLKKYDEDGNGWIDENDAIWSKLRIWCKNEEGEDVLYRLADKGVGAVCLQNAATDFTLKEADGRTKGAIRSTGIFLYENGNVGTVQHVDVAKYQSQA